LLAQSLLFYPNYEVAVNIAAAISL